MSKTAFIKSAFVKAVVAASAIAICASSAEAVDAGFPFNIFTP